MCISFFPTPGSCSSRIRAQVFRLYDPGYLWNKGEIQTLRWISFKTISVLVSLVLTVGVSFTSRNVTSSSWMRPLPLKWLWLGMRAFSTTASCRPWGVWSWRQISSISRRLSEDSATCMMDRSTSFVIFYCSVQLKYCVSFSVLVLCISVIVMICHWAESVKI